MESFSLTNLLAEGLQLYQNKYSQVFSLKSIF